MRTGNRFIGRHAALHTILVGLLIGPLLGGAALAEELTFTRDVGRAFEQAAKQGRPVLCYLNRRPGVSSTRDLRRRAVFRDARVERLGRLFICVELVPSAHPQLVDAWRLRANIDGYVLFAAPDRQRLHGARVTDAAALVDDLVDARRQFGQFLWETELRAVLRDERASSGRLREALERITRFEVRAADRDLAALVRREDLSAALRADAWATLARLSTRPAVETLADHARFDPQARAALASCTPVAGAYLAQWLGQGPPERDQAIYVALCGIVEQRPRRQLAFWRDDDPDAIRREIRWIRGQISQAAMRAYLGADP